MLYLKLLNSQIFPDSSALGSNLGVGVCIRQCRRDKITIRIRGLTVILKVFPIFNWFLIRVSCKIILGFVFRVRDLIDF